MKKRIALIANDKKYALHMARELDVYFAEVAEFCCYGMNEILPIEKLEEEFVVLSSFNIFQMAKEKTDPNTKLIIIDLTLNKETINSLDQLPPDAKALLVSIDYRHCMENITMIYNAGYRLLKLIPYYPGCDYDENINIAVTPGDRTLVPKDISLVVDIGQRCIDRRSVLDIAESLGIENPFSSEAAKKLEQRMFSFNTGFNQLLGQNSNLMEQMNEILKLVPQGLVLTDTKGKIYMSNDMAKSILQPRTEIIDGFNIAEVFPEIINQDSDGNSSLIEINGVNVIVTISEVMTDNEHSGNIITLEYFNKAESRQHKFRRQISGYTHKASYTFEQILGDSQGIVNVKNIAKRMARSDLSICISGESGTGKELFAQSIHNYSNRRDFNFVAVNCSALPENLLESELYGYEEGAFSGAKKGGKIGLFELAHRGTLFLDEIGEMPLPMQAKLLRAIEEKKIMKIGGDNLIDVDVRIICATNRNLLDMVESREFRGDLYYRLSVLPIKIPPLRERKEDILLLMEKFKKAAKGAYVLSPSAETAVLNHSWPGNIRELKNLAEYLSNLEKKVIDIADLPFREKMGIEAAQAYNNLEIMPGEGRAERENRLYLFIMEQISFSEKAGIPIGRQAIFVNAIRNHLDFTESEIRSGMHKLNEKGYVISHKGRRGSQLTIKGQEYLSQFTNRQKGM